MQFETAIYKACEELKKNNIQTAFLDSELLLSQVLKKSKEFIILNSKNHINEKDYCNFKKLICERSKGKPIAYLTGKKFFWKYEFELNDKVLIPRPDTEIIVEQVLKIFKEKNRINFLDIGTGSGCISLSILKEKKIFEPLG